jgi:hypothetical protein
MKTFHCSVCGGDVIIDYVYGDGEFCGYCLRCKETVLSSMNKEKQDKSSNFCRVERAGPTDSDGYLLEFFSIGLNSDHWPWPAYAETREEALQWCDQINQAADRWKKIP